MRNTVDSASLPIEMRPECEPSGCGAWPLFNPRCKWHRYFAMLFICSLSFGSFFCYDMPAALANQMQSDMGISTSQYTLLYSIYSWPNVIFCLFGGFLIDRILGIRRAAVLFSGCCVIGQLLVVLGAFFVQFWLMLCGRFVFGIGRELLSVAQYGFMAVWFKEAELSLVFGIELCLSRLGTSVNFIISNQIYDGFSKKVSSETRDLGLTLFVGLLICIVCLVFAIVMWYLDYRSSKIVATRFRGKTIMQISTVKKFPIAYWLLVVICVCYYSALFSFIALAKLFFMAKYGTGNNQASLTVSIVYITTFLSPIVGIVVDLIGRNLNFLFVLLTGSLISHCLLAFSWVPPWICMILMGLCYCLSVSTLWAMVARIIPQNRLATAYGIMESLQNLGQAVAAIICGMLVENQGYLMLEVFFICCLWVALVAASFLLLCDYFYRLELNLSAKQRSEKQAEENEKNAYAAYCYQFYT